MLRNLFMPSEWMPRRSSVGLALVLAAAAVPCSAAIIPLVIFEHKPESINTTFQSTHQVGGPILADDFDPATLPRASTLLQLNGGVVLPPATNSSSPSISAR